MGWRSPCVCMWAKFERGAGADGDSVMMVKVTFSSAWRVTRYACRPEEEGGFNQVQGVDGWMGKWGMVESWPTPTYLNIVWLPYIIIE